MEVTRSLAKQQCDQSISEEEDRKPWLLGFLCLLIPMLPTYSVLPGPLKSIGSPAKLIAISMFFLVLLGFISVRKSARRDFLFPGVILLSLYFSLTLLVFGVGATHLGTPLAESGKTRNLLNLIACVGPSLYTMLKVKRLEHREFALGCLAVALAYNCLVGILQNSAHVDLRLLLQPPGLQTLQREDGGSVVTLAERFGATRSFGTSAHPIEFAVLAAVAIPVYLHFVQFGARRSVRLLAAAGIGLAVVALPASVSRSGLIALTSALAIYVWAFPVRKVAYGTAAIAATLGALALISPRNLTALWATISGSATDDSVRERVEDYAKVSQTFSEHPVFGLGLGAAPPDEYGLLDNQWLQQLVQGGLVGLLAMLILAGTSLFGVAAALRCAHTPAERDQAFCIGAMAVGLLASSFTFDLFAYQQATLIFFILIGMLWSNFRLALPTNGGSHGRTI